MTNSKKNNNKQLVLRNTGTIAAPMGVAVLKLLVEDKGAQWVAAQVGKGALKLSKSALSWWQSGGVPVSKEVVAAPVPVSMGVGVAGSAKFQGDIRIRHRELIDTYSFIGPGLSAKAYRINPVESSSFPYLSTLARMYDKYKFNSLHLTVVSGTSTASNGRQYMAWDPDSQDQSPNNAAAFMAMRHSMSSAIWQTTSLTIPAQKDFKFTKYFADQQQDHGALYWGATDAGTFDLYLEYDVTLRDPQLSSATTVVTGTTLMTTGVIPPYSGPEIVRSLTPPAPKTILVPAGKYYFSYMFRGTGITAVASTVSSVGTAFTWRERNTTSATQFTNEVIVDCDAPFTLNIGNTYTTLTHGSLVVCQINESQFTFLFDQFA
jgi:hypothetical protein